jgi:hypothetical protein
LTADFPQEVVVNIEDFAHGLLHPEGACATHPIAPLQSAAGVFNCRILDYPSNYVKSTKYANRR